MSPRSPFSSDLLRPGEVFGGMGLLLNFEQQFNVRAVTHVEMCVLTRHEFQKILMRFQHDHPTVLMALLEDVILKNELPFSMEKVFRVTLVDEEQANEELDGMETDFSLKSVLDMDQEPQASDPKTKLTPLEAAHFLMKKINLQAVDLSIKFGFQQVDPSPTPPEPQDAGTQNETIHERAEQRDEPASSTVSQAAPAARSSSFMGEQQRE